MGGSSVALVERLFSYYRSGAMDKAFAIVHPEVEWREDPSFPGATTYWGHAGVAEALTKFVGAWEDFRLEPQDFFAVGEENVVVPVKLTGRGKASGVEVTLDQFQVYTVRDNLIVRVAQHIDRAEAYADAGEGRLS